MADVYANFYSKTITMSAANTLTFEKMDFGLNLFDKVGILLNRWIFQFDTGINTELVNTSDVATVAITSSNSITSIGASEAAVVDLESLTVINHGTAASGEVKSLQISRDYCMYPGGGLLVAPSPLYVAMKTSGFAAASSGTLRMWFTVIKLAPSEYFELLESRQFFG